MIHRALQALSPNAEYSLNAGDYKQLVWLDKEHTKPTKKEVDAWITANAKYVLAENELSLLDLELTREQEDIADLKGRELKGRQSEVIKRKKELRSILCSKENTNAA